MIKVFVIDDSAVIRRMLTDILEEAGDIEVIGTAQDPIFAMNKIRNNRPDVITLDLEMPRMDGLTFLEELMRTDPIPVVMVSSLAQKGCEVTLKALELGAVDYMQKPTLEIAEGVGKMSEDIIRKVRVAAKAKANSRFRTACSAKLPGKHPDLSGGIRPPLRSNLDVKAMNTTDKIIAIGASTGGTQAVTEIVSALPESLPGVVIVQHMPPVFTKSFAERLNSIAKIEVREAVNGERILRGTVYIAPGGKHMAIKREGSIYHIEITDGPMVNFVKPAVDVLFRSVARYAGRNAIGVLLTGMGEDGARGMKEMRESGAFTIAEDESTCVVFGMPKKAIEIGAADRVCPLQGIAKLLVSKV